MIQVHFPEVATIAEAELTAYLQPHIERGRALRNVSLHEIFGAFAHLHARLADPGNVLYHQYRPLGLAHLLHVIHPDSLGKTLDTSLRTRAALDRITELPSGQLVRAEPRGTVVHWLAGNTPLLSLLSVVQALVTKNVSVIKLSSKQPDYITPILMELSHVPGGKPLVDAVTVLAFSGENRAANETLSQLADVRLAWGGAEAVQAIQDLPKHSETIDLIFGPKYSVAVLDPGNSNNDSLLALARDVVMFKQLACSSPHVLYVQGNHNCARAFAAELATALAQQRAEPLDPVETMLVLTYRTEQALDGAELLTTNNTAWTVKVGTAPDPAVGYGVVQVIPFLAFTEIAAQLPKSIQTISHNLDRWEIIGLLDACHAVGVPVCRLPRFGHTHHYQSPWDGMFVHDHLVRWVHVEAEG